MAKNRIETVFEDDRIIVINKPAGVSVTHDQSGKTNLISYQDKQRKTQQDLKIIHQLDKDASGIMILAKDVDTQVEFSDYFKNSQIRKIYLAIITGSPCEKTGTIDAPLAPSKKNHQIPEVNLKEGKDAQTQWELLANFGGLSLLAVRPIADRMYQIQVHLRHADMPLAIDPLYGQNHVIMLSSFKTDYRLGKYEEEKPLIDRLTLCAYEVEIKDFADSGPLHPVRDISKGDSYQRQPVSNGIHLVGPLEKKLKATIKMLTKYNPNGLAAFNNEENFNRLLDSQPLILGI